MKLRMVLGIGGAVLVILAGAVASFLLYRTQVAPKALPHTFPPELSDALFVSAPNEDLVLMTRTGNGFAPVPSQPQHIRSAARAEGHLAVITKEGIDFTVVFDGKTLSSSPFPKRGLTLSPSGTKVAYAESASSTLASNFSSDWNIIMIDTVTGETTKYPNAFSPFFFEEGSIAMFSPSGLRLYRKFTDATSEILDPTPFPDASIATAVAPNRRAFLYVPSDTKQAVLKYITVPGLTVKTYDQLPPEAGSAFVLGDGALYELRPTAAGMEIWKGTLAAPAPALLYTVDATVHLKSIIL